jgi:hypothetical protein
MTAEEANRLKRIEEAFLEIAQKIEGQKSYEAHLSSTGGTSRDLQELRAVTYGKIVRIVNAVMERDAADAGVVGLDPALLNVGDDG